MNAKFKPQIEPREKVDFQLDETIPKYWFNNDPFKTRLFDGLQISFPDGERYFISCVREFRERVKDEKLQEDVKKFTRQEAQHGIAHTLYNKLLEKQGLPIQRMIRTHKQRLDSYVKRFSPEFNVAITASFEHFTALMAEAFFSKSSVLNGMDERMKSLFAWHAIEEMEHRSVAFDVMQQAAQVKYFKRCAAMAYGIWETISVIFSHIDQLLEADGFSKDERRRMLLKNLNWMYGKNGVFACFTPQLLAYFKPGFHPENIPVIHNYSAWVNAYRESNDPMQACEALMAAAY